MSDTQIFCLVWFVPAAVYFLWFRFIGVRKRMGTAKTLGIQIENIPHIQGFASRNMVDEVIYALFCALGIIAVFVYWNILSSLDESIRIQGTTIAIRRRLYLREEK